jgi:hypothetical protein
MAINNPYLPIKVITDGVLDTFAFNWSLTQAQDIKVYFEDSRGVKTLVDTGDYTLQRNTGENGGNIIFNTPPTTGQTLIIERDEEKTQEKEFSNTKSFNLKYFQDALDKLTRWCQEQDYEIGQAIKIPETAATDEEDPIDIWNRIILSDAGESIKYAKIESGNLYVKSKTGSWIMMPKSSNIRQVRQRVEYVDSTPIYIFEYSLNGTDWFDIADTSLYKQHSFLGGRDEPDQHPASSISTEDEFNVQEKLDIIDDAIIDIEEALDLKANLSGATFTGDIEANNLSGENTGDQDLSSYAIDDEVVHLTGEEIITGVKTFNSFPETPSSAPTTDYQVANRKFVLDNAGGSAILPSGTCSTAGATAAKEVSVSGYTETAGACALITFENKNSALGPNLYIPFTGGTAADPMGIYTLTTIGSPTYTDDKFNSNGNTGLSYNISSLGSGAWCIQGKFKSTNTTTNQKLMASNIHFGYGVHKFTDNKLVLNLSGNGTSWSIVTNLSGSKNDWATDTEYYIRLRFTGSAYYVDWSLDGDNWINEITYTSSTPIYSDIGGTRFGISYDNSNPLIGTMDDLYVTIGSATTITDYPTLNINSGGAKYLCHEDGTRINPANPAYFIANCPIQFCYDGTGYRFKREVVKTYVNGVNWYNLRNDGWVEQGGITTSGSVLQSVVLPVTMADTNYTILLTGQSSSNNNNVRVVGYENISTTGFDCRANTVNQNSQTSSDSNSRRWFVAGMAAV